MSFKVQDMIRMWLEQLSMYQCLLNAYNWQMDNEDYIFIRNQIDKLTGLIGDAEHQTDEQFNDGIQDIFSNSIKTTRQKREHSIINLTKNLDKEEFNYVCEYIKNFKMPLPKEVIADSMCDNPEKRQTALDKIIQWIK